MAELVSDSDIGDIGDVSQTHWSPSRSLSYEEWERVGHTLQAMHEGLPWWIGDWLVYGEYAYGEAYTQALTITGKSLSALQNYKWVAGKIDAGRRRRDLSWTAHRHVAHLPANEQDQWLHKACSEEWDGEQLRLALLTASPDSKEAKSTTDNGLEPGYTGSTGVSVTDPENGDVVVLSRADVDVHTQLNHANAVIAQGLLLMPVARAVQWHKARDYIERYGTSAVA